MSDSRSTGQVREWRDEEGWGVLDSADTPGGCWAHFTAIETDGYRALSVGEPVGFTFERADQDGYAFRAVSVRREQDDGARTATPALGQAGAAYGSSLTLTMDDGTVLHGADAHAFLKKHGRAPD